MILLILAGCSRKSGEAVVLEKEHIAAAEITPPTPAPISAASDETEAARDLKPGEIVLDGYLMDKDVRGTSKDPRALTNEQWLVRVELISDGCPRGAEAIRKGETRRPCRNHLSPREVYRNDLERGD